jgi:flagellar assembly protein FliH
MSTTNTWSMPTVDGEISNGNTIRPQQTLQQNSINQLKEQAHQEGYQQGLAKAEGEIAARLAHLNELIDLMEKPAQLIDEQIEQQLLNIVTLVCEQTIQKSLNIEPELINKMLSGALEELITGQMNCKLQLNPEDKAFIEQDVSQSKSLSHCELQQNPQLNRGEFLLSSDSTDIDARLQSRILGILDDSNHAAS